MQGGVVDGLEDGKDGVQGPSDVLADFTMDNIIVADKEDAIDDLSDEDPLEIMRGAEELKVCMCVLFTSPAYTKNL